MPQNTDSEPDQETYRLKCSCGVTEVFEAASDAEAANFGRDHFNPYHPDHPDPDLRVVVMNRVGVVVHEQYNWHEGMEEPTECPECHETYVDERRASCPHCGAVQMEARL